MPDALAPLAKTCPSDTAQSPSSSLSSSAFDQGLLTVSGNLVQLIDASEFADNDDDENREDGGRWLSWLFFNEAMGWAYECLHLRNGDNDRINGTTAFNFKCMFIN
jgi:hypothetical protein